jgi:hypothetical protein
MQKPSFTSIHYDPQRFTMLKNGSNHWLNSFLNQRSQGHKTNWCVGTSHSQTDNQTPSVKQIKCRVRVRVRVTLRLTVSQSVYLGVEPHSGLMTRYSFLIEKLQSCSYGAPSLTRGWVCHLSVIVSSIVHCHLYNYNFSVKT